MWANRMESRLKAYAIHTQKFFFRGGCTALAHEKIGILRLSTTACATTEDRRECRNRVCSSHRVSGRATAGSAAARHMTAQRERHGGAVVGDGVEPLAQPGSLEAQAASSRPRSRARGKPVQHGACRQKARQKQRSAQRREKTSYGDGIGGNGRVDQQTRNEAGYCLPENYATNAVVFDGFAQGGPQMLLHRWKSDSFRLFGWHPEEAAFFAQCKAACIHQQHAEPDVGNQGERPAKTPRDCVRACFCIKRSSRGWCSLQTPQCVQRRLFQAREACAQRWAAPPVCARAPAASGALYRNG